MVCTLKIYDHRRIRVDRPIGPICRQKKNCFFHTNWISTSLTSSRAFSATRTFLKQVLRSLVLKWNTVFHNFVILTVEAGDFSSQASGNTLGVSRVTVGYACEGFFGAQVAASFIEFDIPENHQVTCLDFTLTVLTDNLGPPFGPFGQLRQGLGRIRRR